MADELLGLKITYEFPKFKGLAEEIDFALKEKLVDLGLLLYNKVRENLNGKLLEKKSGDLAQSIKVSTRTSGNPMTITIGPEPMTLKAWVHEFGGKSYYPIYPSKAAMLRFIGKSGDVVFTNRVWHPPAEARHYLGSVLEEVDLQSEFQQMLDLAFAKGAEE